MSLPIAPTRTLPILKAFVHIFSGMSAHWREALKIALPWLMLTTVLNIWSFKTHPPSTNTLADFNLNWTDWVIVALSLVASSSVAVSWHRFILIDAPLKDVSIFRADRLVWLYLVRTLAIFLLCLVPLVALLVIGNFVPPILQPLIFALFLQLMVFGYRMSISLPAQAIGETKIGIKEALELTRHNNLRIFGLIALTYLALILVFLAFVIMIGALPANIALLGSFILGLPVLFFHLLLTTNLLTSLYGFFVQKRDF